MMEKSNGPSNTSEIRRHVEKHNLLSTQRNLEILSLLEGGSANSNEIANELERDTEYWHHVHLPRLTNSEVVVAEDEVLYIADEHVQKTVELYNELIEADIEMDLGSASDTSRILSHPTRLGAIAYWEMNDINTTSIESLTDFSEKPFEHAEVQAYHNHLPLMRDYEIIGVQDDKITYTPSTALQKVIEHELNHGINPSIS